MSDPNPFAAYTIPAIPADAQAVPASVETPAPQPPAPVEHEPAIAESPAQYVVTGADSLLKIAQTFYGDARAAGYIYAANREAIGSDPDRLHTGTILILPAPPLVASAPAAPVAQD